MMDADRPQFAQSRTVTLSELPEAERDAFIRFLAENRVAVSVRGGWGSSRATSAITPTRAPPRLAASPNDPPCAAPTLLANAQFSKEANGSYTANVRLYDPAVLGDQVRPCARARVGAEAHTLAASSRTPAARARCSCLDARGPSTPPHLPQTPGAGSVAGQSAAARTRPRKGESALNRLLASVDTGSGPAAPAAGFDTTPYQRYVSQLGAPSVEAGGLRPKPRVLVRGPRS